MSLIFDLGEGDAKLPDILGRYERELKEAEEHIKIKGKSLVHANEEHASWQVFYDQRRVELRALVSWYEMEVDRVRAILFQEISNHNQLGLSDRGKNQFIEADKRYLHKARLLIEVKELYDRYETVVNAFKNRAYALNNITKLRVSSLDNAYV